MSPEQNEQARIDTFAIAVLTSDWAEDMTCDEAATYVRAMLALSDRIAQERRGASNTEEVSDR